jgi:hypothetical protein
MEQQAMEEQKKTKEKKSRNSPEQLTLFAAGSRDCASHSVKPGSEEARQMTATSGWKCLELFKNSDLTPVGLLQKMLLGSSIWSSTARYLTWKGKVTKSGYSYWVLAPSKPPIKDNDAGLLPTPRKNMTGNPHPNRLNDKYRNLEKVISQKMWPTPRSSEYKGVGPLGSKSQAHMEGRNYLCAIAQKAEGVSGQLNAEWVTWLMGYPPGYLTLEEPGK